jgi:hypothetical protein
MSEAILEGIIFKRSSSFFLVTKKRWGVLLCSGVIILYKNEEKTKQSTIDLSQYDNFTSNDEGRYLTFQNTRDVSMVCYLSILHWLSLYYSHVTLCNSEPLCCIHLNLQHLMSGFLLLKECDQVVEYLGN